MKKMTCPRCGDPEATPDLRRSGCWYLECSGRCGFGGYGYVSDLREAVGQALARKAAGGPA